MSHGIDPEVVSCRYRDNDLAPACEIHNGALDTMAPMYWKGPS
jgi:hypothetical protein